MEFIEAHDDAASVILSRDDINMIISMIGETLEAVDDVELQTRTGFYRDEILEFRLAIKSVESKIAESAHE